MWVTYDTTQVDCVGIIIISIIIGVGAYNLLVLLSYNDNQSPDCGFAGPIRKQITKPGPPSCNKPRMRSDTQYTQVVESILVQRLRRRTNLKSTLIQHFVWTVMNIVQLPCLLDWLPHVNNNNGGSLTIKMRTVSYVDHLKLSYNGNLSAKAVALGDIDNDKVRIFINNCKISYF